MAEALIIGLNAIVKARSSTNGQRLVEVEASNEREDQEGDVILQEALLGSAQSFIARGHIDIDHLSEIGARLGLRNPESYIIGRPVSVSDLGKGRTGVLCEIRRSIDGIFDVIKNKYDAFWESVASEPPVLWRASIYGFPDPQTTLDCRVDHCDVKASRYVIKTLDWRSLAMTRRPINDSINGYAKIVAAKAMVEAITKDMASGWGAPSGFGIGGGMGLSGTSSPDISTNIPNNLPHATIEQPRSFPYTLDHLWGQYNLHISKDCNHTGSPWGAVDSEEGFFNHFKHCCSCDDETAKILAHALMFLVIREKRRLA